MITTIIISYSYHPLNITSAQRPISWVNNFYDLGIYPIVVTRNANENVKDKVVIEKTDKYTVYRIKTSLMLQYQGKQIKGIVGRGYRLFLMYSSILLNSSFIFGPFGDFYKITKNIIAEHHNEKIVLIVTAQPFGLFRVAYKLHKISNIKWIADYRDDWTTSELKPANQLRKIFMKTIYKVQEKKWVGTASFISTVSGHYVNKICNLLKFDNSKGIVVENGYFKHQYKKTHGEFEKYAILSFLYVGSLYKTQNIHPILSALNDLIKQKTPSQKVNFIFLGTAFKKKNKSALIKKYKSINLIFLKRVEKSEALKIQMNCHFAIMCPHDGLKGIPSSKLYEFIGAKMPVIYYPNDNNIIDRSLSDCNLGLTANNTKELKNIFKDILNGKYDKYNFGNSNTDKYSRIKSDEVLVKKIKTLFQK